MPKLIRSSFILSTLVFLSSSLSFAYIPPTRMILQRTSDNAGTGTYAIEQEVEFSNGDDVLRFKETWLVDSDNTMRLTVTGTKDLQNNFKLQYIYAGGQRWSLSGNNRKNEKTSEDFLEKYLNFRSSENFANALVSQKIIPSSALTRRQMVRAGNDFKYDPEPWVRYSRTGGSINYAFGTPTPSKQESKNAGIWIEQDQFVIRKLRLPSQAEMTADDYSQFAKGLLYPRKQTIRWGANTVNINLISISARPKTTTSLFQPSSLDTNIKVEGLETILAKSAILEFYSRFR